MIEAKPFTTKDGTEYMITTLKASRGQYWFTRISKLIAPAIAAAVVPGSEDAVDLTGALKGFVEGVSESDLEKICAEFAAQCTYREPGMENPFPLRAKYDDHFAGETMRWLEWLHGCMEANYSQVFTSLRSLTDEKAPQKTTKIPTEETESESPGA